MTRTRCILLLIAVQTLGFLCFYIFSAIYNFTRRSYIANDLVIAVLFPPFLGVVTTLITSYLLPIKADFKKGVFFSIPATMVYFAIYFLIPISIDFNAEIIPTLCLLFLPYTLFVLLINGLAVWLGTYFKAPTDKFVL